MRKRIIVGASIAAASWAAVAHVRHWQATWGVVPGEAVKTLPGDEVVPTALSIDTRGIDIEAPPELVWPWLLQMGYGRGGWYSIDQLDMRGPSATRIVDEWQRLAVGDIVPTHPGGGFTVKAIEPNHALVLYGDTSTMQPLDDDTAKEIPAGLAASGAFLSATPKDFAASWTFVLEPIGATQTRLIERVRYWGAAGGPLSKLALSAMSFGVLLMMQRQMLGIRTRAESLARGRPSRPADPMP